MNSSEPTEGIPSEEKTATSVEVVSFPSTRYQVVCVRLFHSTAGKCIDCSVVFCLLETRGGNDEKASVFVTTQNNLSCSRSKLWSCVTDKKVTIAVALFMSCGRWCRTMTQVSLCSQLEELTRMC